MTDIKERLTAAYEWMREPDYAEHFSVTDLLKWANRRDVGAHRDALAEIERLEAENALMRSEHAASLIRINAEACEKIAALQASNERMDAALRLVQDALHIGACEYDDVRAMLTTIEQALSTSQPVDRAIAESDKKARTE